MLQFDDFSTDRFLNAEHRSMEKILPTTFPLETLMQHALKLAAVAALCTATAAQAGVAFDANLELDTTYTNEANASASNPARDSDFGMGGRVEVNAGAKLNNGDAFVAARASLLLKKDGNTGTDDMWVQFGNKSGDVKLGRFEAMDLFPLGKDTVVDEVNGTYKANALRGRMGGDAFHGALGLNASDNLRVELGLVFTKDAGASRGFRPAVSYTSGPLTVRAGLEAVKKVGAASSDTGLGLSVGYALAADSNLNVNFAKKEDDKAFGVNATFGALGLGLISGKGATDATKATTLYAAYSMPLFGVKGASVTPALSVSKGGSGQDTRTSARVRINYAF